MKLSMSLRVVSGTGGAVSMPEKPPMCCCSRSRSPHPHGFPSRGRGDWCPIKPVPPIGHAQPLQMPQPRKVDYAAVHITKDGIRVTDTQGVTAYEQKVESTPIGTPARCESGECVECGICLPKARLGVASPGWCGECAPYSLAAWFWFYSPVGRLISRWQGMA